MWESRECRVEEEGVFWPVSWVNTATHVQPNHSLQVSGYRVHGDSVSPAKSQSSHHREGVTTIENIRIHPLHL